MEGPRFLTPQCSPRNRAPPNEIGSAHRVRSVCRDQQPRIRNTALELIAKQLSGVRLKLLLRLTDIAVSAPATPLPDKQHILP